MSEIPQRNPPIQITGTLLNQSVAPAKAITVIPPISFGLNEAMASVENLK